MDFDCIWGEYEHTEPGEIVRHLKGAAIAVTHKTRLNEENFKHLPDLKMITTNSTGFNTIDITVANQYGITVFNIQDWCTNTAGDIIKGFIDNVQVLQVGDNTYSHGMAGLMTVDEATKRTTAQFDNLKVHAIGKPNSLPRTLAREFYPIYKSLLKSAQ